MTTTMAMTITAGGLSFFYFSAVADAVIALADVAMVVVTMALVEITAVGSLSSYYSAVAVSAVAANF